MASIFGISLDPRPPLIVHGRLYRQLSKDGLHVYRGDGSVSLVEIKGGVPDIDRLCECTTGRGLANSIKTLGIDGRARKVHDNPENYSNIRWLC